MTTKLPGYRTLSPDELVLISNLKIDTGRFLLDVLGQVRQHIAGQRAAATKMQRAAARATVHRDEVEAFYGAPPSESVVFNNAGFTAIDYPALVSLSGRATAELKRIDDAQPERWLAIANTHFQEGVMALVRAVAQPEGF